jgi:hypothetical protein
MTNESFESQDERFERIYEEEMHYCESVLESAYIDTFELLQMEGIGYLNRSNNEGAICMVYEALIFFMLHEDFKKCSIIRKYLDEFQNINMNKLRIKYQNSNTKL